MTGWAAAEQVGRAVPIVAGALGAGGLAVAALPRPVATREELRRRWRTWALAAPVFLGALALGAPGAALLAAGLAVIAVAEYARLTSLPRADLAVLVAGALAVPAAAWLRPQPLGTGGLALLVVAGALPAVLSGDTKAGGSRAARTVFGLLWLPVALAGLVTLGPAAAVAVGVSVAFGDVGAWCGGRLLGRSGPGARRLSPLSPGKTWGGVAGSAAGSAGALAALGSFTLWLWGAVLAGCVLGDLLESMIKREAGVKDAGSWLPGFGGLLDRIDSLLLALLLAQVAVGGR